MQTCPMSGPMVKIHMKIKTELVFGGKMFTPGCMQLNEVLSLTETAQPPAGQVSGFYLAMYDGAGSSNFSLRKMPDDGITEIEFDYMQGSVDTLKIVVAAKQNCPKGARCIHIASSFISRDDLLKCLKESMELNGGFDSGMACLVAPDNFSKNKALHRFMNCKTDLARLQTLSLRPSALLRLDDANEAVKRLGTTVENIVCSCAVSPLNAGSHFVQSFTFGHLSGHLMHYAIVGYLFGCIDTPVQLCHLMYNAFQAQHSTQLSFEALKSMSDADLVNHFGRAVIAHQTCCALTNLYNPDMTVDRISNRVCKLNETEDMAKTFSQLNFLIQNSDCLEPYNGNLDCVNSDMTNLVRDIVQDQNRMAMNMDGFGASRKTPSAISDDCENGGQGIMKMCDCILKTYKSYPTVRQMSEAMSLEASKNSRIFAECKKGHYDAMADVLIRLGKMIESRDWSVALAVASAKGPSYNENCVKRGEELCGHGVCISRVWDKKTDSFIHAPIEGTTYLRVDVSPSKDYAQKLPLKLQDGSVKEFPLEVATTLLAQNIHEIFGLSPHANILAHLRTEYEDALNSPFYMSVFYTGLGVSKEDSLGCIPMDAKPPPDFGSGNKPLFGAAVMGLSCPNTVAVPVTSSMLADPQNQLAGTPDKLAGLLKDQVNEAWGPGMTTEQARNYLSYLQPVADPSSPMLGAEKYGTHIKSENTWAFDDPVLTRKAVRVYSILADRFNQLQNGDPLSDRATAKVFGQYLSATLVVCLPVPKAENTSNFSLSVLRNMRQAAKDVGLVDALSSCLVKTKMIQARAAVPSDHHVYMCANGEGFVHAHRIKLA